MNHRQHPNPGDAQPPHVHNPVNPYLQGPYHPIPLPGQYGQHYGLPPGAPNYAFPPGVHYAPQLPPGAPQYAPPTHAQPQQYLPMPFTQAPMVPARQRPNSEPRPGGKVP
jgi:hypothetical protein